MTKTSIAFQEMFAPEFLKEAKNVIPEHEQADASATAKALLLHGVAGAQSYLVHKYCTTESIVAVRFTERFLALGSLNDKGGVRFSVLLPLRDASVLDICSKCGFA